MNVWHKEIVTLLLSLLAVIIIGAVTGNFIALLFLLMFFIIIKQITQINRFEKWMRSGGRGNLPKTTGIWEEIYYHVYRLRKSERRRKKKLSNMIDQLRQSTEALPDAAIVLGIDDEIDWTNKAARKIFGLQQADKGQRIPNLIRFPEFIRYLKTGNYKESVIFPSPTDNRITLEVRVIPYGAGLRLLLAQDISQVKKMERMRKDFVANVSHELRTPLTVLKGYLETLLDMEGDNLDNASGRIKLNIETDAHIQGEEHELRSAFTNLLGNALKYSNIEYPITVRWFHDTKSLVLSIEDQGEGISKNDIPRVTERFFRVETKRVKKISGTGLGLAIVKHVLMRHDARLNITSVVGKGSCFSCHFPIERLCIKQQNLSSIA